jgi:hypothetical protein
MDLLVKIHGLPEVMQCLGLKLFVWLGVSCRGLGRDT